MALFSFSISLTLPSVSCFCLLLLYASVSAPVADELCSFLRYVRSLGFYEQPHYRYLKILLQQMHNRHKLPLDSQAASPTRPRSLHLRSNRTRS
jgi:hypothetical protein